MLDFTTFSSIMQWEIEEMVYIKLKKIKKLLFFVEITIEFYQD